MILTTRFGYASTKLIHSVEKNLYVVLVVIVSTATLLIVNTLGILNFLYSGDIDYTVDVILSVILVAVLVPLDNIREGDVLQTHYPEALLKSLGLACYFADLTFGPEGNTP